MRYHMIDTHRLSGSPIQRSLGNRRGQTLVEYALVLALISVVAISVLVSMGGQVKGVYTTVSQQIAIAGNGGPVSAPPIRPP
jgi:Flp pilus assembly pilin Flp